MSECIFCKIVAKEIPTRLVYDNECVIAFADIEPKAPVHLLVVPREHVATFNDLPPNSKIPAAVTSALQQLARDFDVASSGYRIIANVNTDGGQTVAHVHWHLLGGKPLGAMVGA